MRKSVQQGWVMEHQGDPGYHHGVSLHLARALDEAGLNKLTVKWRIHHSFLHIFADVTITPAVLDHRGDPGYRRAVSLHLARALDEAGLNKLTVKKRRHARLFAEQMLNVYIRLIGYNDTSYHFGSQTEGATTPGMMSDMDTLHCLSDVNVIEDWVDWKQGKKNLLMLHEDTVPGYCRLQLLRPSVPMARENLPSEDYTYDSSGRVVLKNTFMHSLLQQNEERSGPAASESGSPGFMDTDEVWALSCSSWPVQAEEFIRRRRRHGWPSQRLIEEATSQKLQARLNTEPTRVPKLDSLASVWLVGAFERDKHESISIYTKWYIVKKLNELELPLIKSANQTLNVLKEKVRQEDKHKRRALLTFIPPLSCWLGSLLASFSLSHNRRVPRQAIQLMSTGADYDVASMLKLASVFYCSGKLRKAEAVLQTVEHHYDSNDMLIVCGCYEKYSYSPLEFCHMIYELKGKKIRAKLFAPCVIFSRHEIHCVPPALRHEMHRSVGDDIQHRDPDDDDWMVLAAVDCLPFLYYLQYLTYTQLGEHGLQRRSLRNLNRCVREDHDFRHLETAWNLLGQCLEDEQDPDAAMTCYRTSLEIRPRNNAANWLVAILWYKMARNRGLLSDVAGDQIEK